MYNCTCGDRRGYKYHSFAYFFVSLECLVEFYLEKGKIIWMFNTFSGFVIAFAGIPIKDTAVQHLYPIKPS